jgi:hypothetical protein
VTGREAGSTGTQARVAGAPAVIRRRSALLVALVVCAVALIATGCGSSGTTEVSGTGIGWGTLDDSPPLADGGGGPGPQVMAEVTLPDGGVPTVPQPTVPAAPTATVLSATESARAPATSTPPPPVLAAPSVGATGPLPAVQLPEAVPGGARAVERLATDAQRAVASQALGRIRFDWRTVLAGWQVRFLPGRTGLRGSTFPDTKVIEVYVRRGDDAASLSHVIAHEMGHAVDVSRLGDAQRSAWSAARGYGASVPWFPTADGARDYATGAGDWAESFARWQTGVGWYSELGPPPDALQTVLMAQLAGLA